MESEMILEAHRKFSEALAGNDLNGLAKAAYTLTGCPVLINDEMGANLAIAPDHAIGDVDFDELVKNKNSTVEHFDHFYRQYIINRKMKKSPVHIYDGDRQKRHQMFSVLYFDRNTLGYVSFLLADGMEIGETYREVMEIFNTYATSIIIAKKEREHINIQRSNHILNYLLTSEDRGSDAYRKNARRLSIRYSGAYVVLIIRCLEESDEDIYTIDLFSLVRRNIQNLLFTDVDQCIYILVSNYEADRMQQMIAELEKKVAKFPVKVSTSMVFEKLEKIYDYAAQARLTMQVGQRIASEDFFWYRADRFLPLQVYCLFEEQNSIEPYMDERMKAMLLYDRENGTEYMPTLMVYVFCFMNAKETAKLLCIHANTLHYRIQRMQELFGMDFADYYYMNQVQATVGLMIAGKKYNLKYLPKQYFARYLTD